MPFQLVPAGARLQPIRLDKAVVLFGRHPDCDVVITSSRKVSRKHCCIAQVNNTYVVRDLGSMNGVRVNGVAVKRTARLKPGDELIVGDVVFHLREEAKNGRASSAASPRPASAKPVPPHMISQDIPVVIPEEEQSFAVEESSVKSPTDAELPIELGPEDIVEDDSKWEIEIVE
jgi:pSer/pThr/pTyr-binding forkhead associated (FHA) protein